MSAPAPRARRPLAASFRDWSGFVFSENGVIYRQVNTRYRPDYDQLTSSGLYEALVSAGLLRRSTPIRNTERKLYLMERSRR